MATLPPLIELDAASVRMGAVHILRSVDLRIEAGETVGVYGANGAGKTTLLRLLATLQPLSGGSGRVLGADLVGDARFSIRPRIGYVGHVPGLYPELTLAENLAFVARIRGIAAARVPEVLAAVGLTGAADRRVDRSSHGMQRRIEFARILLSEPDILLLDEPHSALDADAVDLVDAIVGMVTSSGGAAVMVSHDRTHVRALADRFVEVRSGSLR